jgi:alpha-acetolactate decarboxylase
MKTGYLLFSAGFILMTFMMNASVFAQKTAWKVENAGAMREMFRTGEIEGKIEVSKLLPRGNLYAVGPLADLSGEIMIWDGKPLISFIKDGRVGVETDPNAKAVFFVWASVERWRGISVPETVKSYDELEKFIAESAERMNLDSAAPFPFLLKGAFASVDYHINNYKPDGEKLTREKHDVLKYKARLENKKLEMLGFYSTKHKAVFTHHDRLSHLHVTDGKKTFIGHVDDLALDGRVKLFLPVK